MLEGGRQHGRSQPVVYQQIYMTKIPMKLCSWLFWFHFIDSLLVLFSIGFITRSSKIIQAPTRQGKASGGVHVSLELLHDHTYSNCSSATKGEQNWTGPCWVWYGWKAHVGLAEPSYTVFLDTYRADSEMNSKSRTRSRSKVDLTYQKFCWRIGMWWIQFLSLIWSVIMEVWVQLGHWNALNCLWYEASSTPHLIL